MGTVEAVVSRGVAGHPGDFLLARLDRLPLRLINDPKVGQLLDDPVGFPVAAGQAFAGHRILDITLPVPDEPADIELIVEDAGAAGHMAADRGILPDLAPWSGNAFGVQGLGDGARAAAGGELAEDAADDGRFV